MLDINKLAAIKRGTKVDHLYYNGIDKSYGIYQNDNDYMVVKHYKDQDRNNDRYVCSSLSMAFEIIEKFEDDEEV